MDPEISFPETAITFGHAQSPKIALPDRSQQTALAGTISDCWLTPANSARRRICCPTLLGSPARRGHIPSKSFFSTQTDSTSSAKHQLPLRPKLANHINSGDVQLYSTSVSDTLEGATLYPTLVLDEELVLNPTTRNSKEFHPWFENIKAERQNDSFGTPLHRSPPILKAARLSPCPLSPQDSFFNKKPQISHAQLVTLDQIDTALVSLKEDLHSSSSASWTGDSEFYIPKEKAEILQQEETKSGIPYWLDQLPWNSAEFEKEWEVVVPLTSKLNEAV